jgi:hypothetical protein
MGEMLAAFERAEGDEREGLDGTRIFGLLCWSQHGLRARMKSAHGEPIVDTTASVGQRGYRLVPVSVGPSSSLVSRRVRRREDSLPGSFRF